MYPAMSRYPIDLDRLCIYRAPKLMRQVKPEAYTPRQVLIGPLHLPLKFQALKALDHGDYNMSDYVNMEEQKKFYLEAFAERFEGEKTIIMDGFKRMIEEEEENIRESYSESTAWIKSSEFVDMVLLDSVFIVEFMLRAHKMGREKTGDPLIDTPCIVATAVQDLIMLENQLPYFILEKLFDPIVQRVSPQKTFRDLTIIFFNLQGKIGDDSKFKHFTDLHRCVRVETLPNHDVCIHKQCIQHAYNADKLDNGGVKFEAVEEEFSLNVRFENGCLKMPRLMVDDRLETTLRNIMALERCHYPLKALVSSYVLFLGRLINTKKDSDLLIEKEIIKNRTRDSASVAQTLNKLGSGVAAATGSYYFDVAVEVNKYSESRVNRTKASLKRGCNLKTAPAIIAVTLFLVLNLIKTWAMVTLVYQNES